ncbi:MAG: hypothetical protein RBT11_12525 [Desulfobacterales bacterium]|jgi:hypothetical protein|nr:hypothetical protein [Desulfobacterales bacterium]
MELRPAFQIQSILKTMKDVIIPAVDTENKMAQEQAQLVLGMLNLLAQQLPLIYRYDCVELSRLIKLANALRDQLENEPGMPKRLQSLVASTQAGEEVLDRAKAEPLALEAAIFSLREKVGQLIQAVYAESEHAESIHRISRTVLTAAKEQLLRERAWVNGQGWEPFSTEIPSIETLIGEGLTGPDS